MKKSFLISGIAYGVESARDPFSLTLEPARSGSGIEELTLSCDFGRHHICALLICT